MLCPMNRDRKGGIETFQVQSGVVLGNAGRYHRQQQRF